MIWRMFGLLVVSLAAALLLATASDTRAEESVPRISSDELKSRLGEKDLVILDARQLNEWINAVQKIAGAQRVDPKDVASWADNYAKDQVLVIYCT